MGSSSALPLLLTLEFARVEQTDDPYGFRFAPQDYLLRTAGGGFERAQLSWDAALQADLDAARKPGRDPVVLQRLGETLRAFLMPLGWGELSAQILGAVQAGRRVLVTFRSAAAELYALPWELLTLKASGQHLGELAGVLLRYEWPETTTRPEQPVPRQGSGRILLAWSAAGGPVPAAEHGRAIASACRSGQVPFEPARDELANASPRTLSEALAAAKKNNQPIAVLHLLAHGGPVLSTFGLLLDRDSQSLGEESGAVDAGRLRQLLAPYADMVRLVVLMACDSGNGGAIGNQLGSIAQTLHRAGIAAVVASRYPLSVAGSVRLGETLYRRLLDDLDSLEGALLHAREELAQEAAHADWVSVQLYARAADGADTRPVVFRPYQGLESFDLAHRRFYFGRAALVDKLWQRCSELFGAPQAVRLLAILGPSGSGKSSVARAGLLAELLRRPLPGMESLQSVVFKPGDRPLRALERAVAELPAAAADTPQLVLVDQFEEVYTLCSDPAERGAFVEWLLSAARDRTRRVSILLTLRSDFFGETQRHHPALNQLIAAQHELVPGLTDSELREAIAEPARCAGRPLDADTVALILEEAHVSQSALPLVSFALARIWEGMLAGTPPGTTLRELGGVGGALAAKAKEIYGALGERERATARRSLTRLVQLGDGTRDTRRRAPVVELCGRGESEAHVLTVLRRFASESARMVTLASDSAQTTAEVTHEALFDCWSELRKWIDDSRADRRFHDRIAQAAQLWGEDRSRLGRLWRSPDLDLLRSFRARKPEDLSDLDEDFFLASEAAEQAELAEKQRRARWQRVGVALLSCSLLVAISVAGYAIKEQRIAQTARQLAEERELTMIVENGRRLLIERDLAGETLLRLMKVYQPGARAPLLEELLNAAARRLEALELVLTGHANPVGQASYSPDGLRIVTAGGKDHTARVWDAQTGKELLILTGHTEAVGSASFSPSGRLIVTGSEDHSARVWEAQTGQLKLTLQGHTGSVRSARFRPDGRRIVTAGTDGTARVWDSETGEPLLTLTGPHTLVSCVSYSPDGLHIATGSYDHVVRVWEEKTGQLLITLPGHRGAISSVSYSPDGKRIVTTGTDDGARVWDARTGQLLLTLLGHSNSVVSADYSPDGLRIVTASEDATARVWDAYSGYLVATFEGHTQGLSSASYRPDGLRIVTSSSDQTARVWNAQPSQLVTTLEGHFGDLSSASYRPDGLRIVTGGGDRTARVWDAQSGQLLGTLKGPGVITSVSYRPDGLRIVTGSEDHTARVWDAQSNALLLTLQGHKDMVRSVGYRPDGRRLVTASHDRTARVWDAQSGMLLLTLTGHAGPLTSAGYSPDGLRIVTGSHDHTARVWDAQSGQLLLTLRGHSGSIMTVSYSPDGRRIVTGALDRTAGVWDAQTGRLLLTLRGHLKGLTSVGYRPDGLRIVTGSFDRSVRVWDAQTGQLLSNIAEHSNEISGVSYHPDGRHILSSSSDWTARVWDVAPQSRQVTALQALLRCRVPQQLEGDAVVQAPTDPAACRQLAAMPLQPLRWGPWESSIWAGVYALRSGQLVAARTVLAEARRRVEHFQNPMGLAMLSLTEAALSVDPAAQVPLSVADLLHGIDPSDQPYQWKRLAGLATTLRRPRWALWVYDEVQRTLPADPDFVAAVRAEQLEALLIAGMPEPANQQAVEALQLQNKPKGVAVVAALGWVAALSQGDSERQRVWGSTLLKIYAVIHEGEDLYWSFNNLRESFRLGPESAARTATLALLAILEQVKSPETTQQLKQLLEPAVSAPERRRRHASP